MKSGRSSRAEGHWAQAPGKATCPYLEVMSEKSKGNLVLRRRLEQIQARPRVRKAWAHRNVSEALAVWPVYVKDTEGDSTVTSRATALDRSPD